MLLLRRVLASAALVLPLAGRAQAPEAPPACPPPVEAPTPQQMNEGLRAARDHGFLWRLQKDGRVSYLYGTVHVARRAWMFPGPRVREALLASDSVALELDMLEPYVQRRLAAGMAARPGERLPAALAQRVAQRARAECAPPEAVAQFGPEMQLATLTMLAARREGLEAAYGIDIFLAGFARGLGKPVHSLETVEQQLQSLRMPSQAEALALVDSGLAELESGRAQGLLARVAQVWASGDHATLARYEQWCDCRETPAEASAMRRLLDDRNPALAAGIDALHARGRRVFAAIGSLHMVGPRGLPALLAQRGYQVERLPLEEPMPDILGLWDFNDPARSETAFRAQLENATLPAALTLRTQIARTYSLRGRFDEAHAMLDGVDAELAGAGPEPRVRSLLERGRTWRSAKQPDRARPLFLQALALATPAGLEYLAVDAMHMMALVEPDTAAQLQWNRRALAAAQAASDPQARGWDASLANNIGMSLHDAGRFAEALESFRSALAARERLGDPQRTRVARWMVAWTLRALQRHDEALAMLTALEAEFAAAGTSDGYVFEEIGENLLAQGQRERARPYFARAHATLSKDDSPDRPDDQHLARLLELAR